MNTVTNIEIYYSKLYNDVSMKLTLNNIIVLTLYICRNQNVSTFYDGIKRKDYRDICNIKYMERYKKDGKLDPYYFTLDKVSDSEWVIRSTKKRYPISSEDRNKIIDAIYTEYYKHNQ